MTDFTKIEKPFGLLDKATQDALKAHFEAGGKVEFLGRDGKWGVVNNTTWLLNHTYRAAPKKHRIKLWVYLLADGSPFVADGRISDAEGMIAIKQIEVEMTEGEGLSC